MIMGDDFAGKTAVLTGAGSGFGLELARLAAKRGMQLVLVDVQADALGSVRDELSAAGCDVMAERVDVADAAQMEALAARVRERFGAPHLVFNNAGVGAGGLLWENTLVDWQWVLGVNLWGVIHGVRLFVPMMMAAAARDPAWRGHVVNTASMAGLLTMPNMGVYNVSKHAVVSLTETLHQDLRLVSDQVGASVLCPYFVPTGIGRSERNRAEGAESVATLSQRLSHEMTAAAVEKGRVSAADVAKEVFAAVSEGRFYIYSHPKALGAVEQRMQAIVRGENPPDPFAARPELGQRLTAALRS